jgi:YidC/Oxa1 family membrane protein insertase
MNKNTLLGFGLLFMLLMAYDYFSRPDATQVAAYKNYQDSLRRDSINAMRMDSLKEAQRLAVLDSLKNDTTRTPEQIAEEAKKLELLKQNEQFGDLYPSGTGEAKDFVVKNDKLQLTFSSKGGKLVKAEVLGFEGYDHTTADRYDRKPVVLFDNPKNKFDYLIPMTTAKRGAVSSADLYFEGSQETPNSIKFRAYAATDKSRYFEQTYTLTEDYNVKYEVNLVGMQELMPMRTADMELQWHTYLGKIEKNDNYERTMSSIHYKAADDSPTYCNCATSVQQEAGVPLQWIGHSQQFFNFSVIGTGNTKFKNAAFETFMTPHEDAHLKELKSNILLPLAATGNTSYTMQFYIGPNDYNIMSKLGVDLESIIPFGWSIFGAIGEYLIRPLFNVLATFIPSYGLIIIILTLIIRLLIYPLQYKMLLSGVKMSLLRPEIEAMRKKHEGNSQAMQMEQMKMFQQYGVNPLGGCLPMLLTMPIWIALYRFFPASIEFRQKSFLWAEDLASYDSILDFSFNIPFYGDHISLFTLLWVVSMFAFLKYNASQMDMSAAGGNAQQMKFMMYLQYAFPVIFFFALNSWAAGLTAYMLFSNVLNILQTFVTKNYVISKEKVRAQMDENKRNPKVSAWQKRLEEMTKLQQQQKK